MGTIDLNADVGEAEDRLGIDSELAILQYVSSANIACGGHRGDARSMRRLVRAAKERGVQIGAHPSYPDRENFGRRSDLTWIHIDPHTLYRSLAAQITSLAEIAKSENYSVAYVKPHGALYNDAVVSAEHAELIARLVSRIDLDLGLMGSPKSEIERAAKKYELRFIAEGFVDRRYVDTGHLQNRSIYGAVIEKLEDRIAQTLSLINNRSVVTASGKMLALSCDTLCLHGDSPGAVETARHARAAIETAGTQVKPFAAKGCNHANHS